MGKKKQPEKRREVFVLAETSSAGGSGLAYYAGADRLPVDKLKKYIESFTTDMSTALQSCQRLPGDFELSEVTLEAKLDLEVGFLLIAKGGVGGTVSLKFAHPQASQGGSRPQAS